MTPGPVSPFRDIESFRYADRAIFFGRRKLRRELLANVILYRLSVVFGDSGVGKSSVLNAGLIPDLLAEGYRPDRIRVRPVAAQPFQIERIKKGLTAGDYLESNFVVDEPGRTPDNFVPLSIEEFELKIREASASPGPVLVFDQFEELFTLLAEGRDLLALQRNIIDLVLRLANDPILRVKLLLVIREDFFGKLQVLAKEHVEAMNHRVRLLALEPENAKQAIRGAFESNEFKCQAKSRRNWQTGLLRI